MFTSGGALLGQITAISVSGRGFTPEEVAEMANFLMSKGAKSISGQIFEMDYGIVTFKI